jgi:hypothetical protein
MQMDRGNLRGDTRRDFRRIGRKALASGKTLALLEARSPAPASRSFSYRFKRWHALVPLAIILVVGSIWGAQAYMHAQQIAKQEATAAAETERARSVSKKAEACRQEKVQANADKVSTMTYDQLYGKSCDY